jgi:hypothetical protein
MEEPEDHALITTLATQRYLATLKTDANLRLCFDYYHRKRPVLRGLCNATVSCSSCRYD